jgi:DNA-binding Lrp family transcriptional regulator
LSEQSIPTTHDVEADTQPTALGHAKMPHYILSNPRLTPRDREVYAHLDTHWRAHNDTCWPGQRRLANKAGVSVRTVQRSLDRLAAEGVIAKRRRGLNKTNVYTRLPAPRHLQAVPGGPDTSAVTYPDTSCVSRLDATPVTHKADAVEADEEEADKPLSVADGACAPPHEQPDDPVDEATEEALALLVQALSDADGGTLRVFRRDYGHLRDPDAIRFTMDVLERRRLRAGVEPIGNEAGYARGVLEAVANGYSSYGDWSAYFPEPGCTEPRSGS